MWLITKMGILSQEGWEAGEGITDRRCTGNRCYSPLPVQKAEQCQRKQQSSGLYSILLHTVHKLWDSSWGTVGDRNEIIPQVPKPTEQTMDVSWLCKAPSQEAREPGESSSPEGKHGRGRTGDGTGLECRKPPHTVRVTAWASAVLCHGRLWDLIWAPARQREHNSQRNDESDFTCLIVTFCHQPQRLFPFCCDTI